MLKIVHKQIFVMCTVFRFFLIERSTFCVRQRQAVHGVYKVAESLVGIVGGARRG
ncbi:hypothetical protein IAE36_004370, partial [Pseudomonas sp. S36]|nr:hypothetical protein [Pseudomonas sp. S36]